MTRVTSAARLYVVNKYPLIYIPAIVFGASWALTLIIQAIVNAVVDPGDSTTYFNGAFQSVFWCILGVAIAASTQMFPFAFAMSLTRREFWLGSLTAMSLASLTYSVLYTLVAWIERLTSGYGLGARYFLVLGGGPTALWQLGVLFLGAFLMFFLVGFTSSMVWKRFNGRGLVVAGLGGFIVIAALLAWAGLTNAWASIGHWFTTQSLAAFGGYMAAIAAVLALGSFLMIRHAEP